jgi:hypothetical protein
MTPDAQLRHSLLMEAGPLTWTAPLPLPVLDPARVEEVVLSLLTSMKAGLAKGKATAELCHDVFVLLAWGMDTRYTTVSPAQKLLRNNLPAAAVPLVKQLVALLTSEQGQQNSAQHTAAVAAAASHFVGLEQHAAGRTTYILVLVHSCLVKLLRAHAATVLKELQIGGSSMIAGLHSHVDSGIVQLEQMFSAAQAMTVPPTKTIK